MDISAPVKKNLIGTITERLTYFYRNSVLPVQLLAQLPPLLGARLSQVSNQVPIAQEAARKHSLCLQMGQDRVADDTDHLKGSQGRARQRRD